jgi:hypothetical protein
MKIEIDLNDILGDESGAETLQESVRRQVIQSISETIKKGVGERIDAAVEVTISEGIKTYLAEKMPSLLANIMEEEYTPVGRYGEAGKPTCFRKELLKSITENMTYKKQGYDSDKNPFSRAVDSVVEENLKLFKADFKNRVDAEFTESAMRFASDALKKKLGIV